MKATEEYFPVVLFIILYSILEFINQILILKFKNVLIDSLGEIIKWYYWNERSVISY